MPLKGGISCLDGRITRHQIEVDLDIILRLITDCQRYRRCSQSKIAGQLGISPSARRSFPQRPEVERHPRTVASDVLCHDLTESTCHVVVLTAPVILDLASVKFPYWFPRAYRLNLASKPGKSCWREAKSVSSYS